MRSYSQGCSLVSFYVAPSPNSAPKNDTTVCKGSPLNLFASIPVLKTTTSYTVNAIPFIDTLPCESSGSLVAGAGVNQDDQYSPLQAIGFPFCFYGNQYSNVAISDNGFLTFTAAKAGQGVCIYTAPTLSPALTLTTTTSPPYTLPPNSILGALSDILVATNYTPPGGGTISVQTVGVAPFRAFIVKFSDCRYFFTACRSNAAIRLNMKIVLYETTNMIDIYVKSKPICVSGASSMYNATQGLQGNTASEFIFTPGRNNTLWSATNSAYRYTPNGTTLTTSVQWTKAGAIVSNTNTASINPTDDSAYYLATATIVSSCPNVTITAKDSIKVRAFNNIVSTVNRFDTIKCVDSIILNATTAGVKFYQWQDGSTNTTKSVNASGVYWVLRAYDSFGCTRDTLFFNVLKKSKLKIDSFQRIGCFNSLNNGQVKIFISGDTTGAKYGLTFNPTNSNPTISGLGIGLKKIWVMNASGCIDSISITNDSLITTFSKRNTFCNTDSSGMMKLVTTGGYQPYTFSLSGKPNQLIDSFNKLLSGTYTISVTDKAGCVVSKTDIVAPTSAHQLQIIIDTVKCYGTSTGKITAIMTNGSAPYSYTIDTSTTYTSSNVFNGLSAKSYLIKSKDNANCRIDSNVIVPQLTAIQATFTNQKNCPFNANGGITVTASGGKPSYQYKLNSGSFQVSNSFTNVLNGIHSISIMDINNCTVIFNDTLTSHPKPDLTLLSKKNISCYNFSDGKIKVQTNSGTLSYSYSWSFNSVNQDSLSGIPLSASPISITVSDANTCKDTLLVSLTQPDSVHGSFILTNPLCYNSSTGKIKAIGTGGTPPYTYVINGGGYSSTDTFINLPFGNHTISIRDSNLCTKSITVNLTNPTKLLASILVDSVSCFGGNNGKITINGLNAKPPYTYTINSGTYSATNIFLGLIAGSYNLSIRDSNNCQFDTSTIVYQYSKVSMSFGIIDTIRCKNGSDGKLSITASNGLAPYTYSINGGGFQASNIFGGLNKGKKIFQVKDAKNCIVTDSFTLSEPPGITTTFTLKNHVSCRNGSNGSAKVSIVGGSPPYTYIWSNGTTIDSVNNLNAGNQYIVIRDNRNCSDSIPFIITQPDSLKSTKSLYHPLCNISLGQVKLSAIGGTPPYKFSLTTTPAPSFGSTDTFFNLNAGLYYYRIQDSLNCIWYKIDSTLTLIAPPALTATYIVDSVKCFGGNDGKITINASGGTGAYTYYKNSALLAGNILNTLTAGTYLIGVKDANNCSIDSNRTVYQYSDISQTNIPYHINCFGASTGSIKINPNGGAGGYLFSLNGGGFSSLDSFSNLPAGTQFLILKDKYNCQKSYNINLTQNPRLIANPIKTHNLCFGDSIGKIIMNVSGGKPPYSYIHGTNPSQTKDTFYNLKSGQYSYFIIDSLNCNIGDTFTITQPPKIILNPTVDSVKCFKVNTGQIIANTSGGVIAYQYSLNGQAYVASNTFPNLAAGTYNVKVRDNNLCTKDTNVTVYSVDSFYQFYTADSIKCNNQATGQMTINALGGKSPYQYNIDGGVFGSSNIITGINSGNHIFVTKDGYGCQLTFNYVFNNPTPIAVQLDSLIHNNCFGDTKGKIQISTSGAKLPHTYLWSNASTSNINSSLAANAYILTVTDNLGCQKTATYSVLQPNVLFLDDNNKRNIRCKSDSDAYINIVVSGGTHTYSYIWSTGATSPGINNLKIGSYTLTVTDSKNCTASKTVTITEPNAINFNLTVNKVSCKGVTNGQISVSNLTGGTAPFTYSWSHSLPSGPSNSNLSPFQTYKVTVTDANNCKRDDSAYLDTAYSLRANLTVTQIPRCPYSPVSITINPTTGQSPYIYKVGSIVNDSGKFIKIPNGKYLINIKDNNGCEYDSIYDFIPKDTLVAELINYIPACIASNIWNSKLNVTGGLKPYIYSWPGAVNVINGDSAQHDKRGYYTAEVVDGYGCKVSKLFNLNPIDFALQAYIAKKNLRCYNSPEGEMTVIASGGQPPYSYEWSDGQTSETATNLSANIKYFATVTDFNGCKYYVYDTLSQPDSLWMDVTVTDQSCRNKFDGAISILPYGGTAKYKKYMFALDSPQVFQKEKFFIPVSIGNHRVYLKDENQCVVSRDVNLKYKYNITPQLDTIYSVILGNTVDITANVTFNPQPKNIKYTWVPSIGLTCPDCLQTTFNGYESGYRTLEIEYGDGCIEKLTTYIQVINDIEDFYVPNVFTTTATDPENRVFKAYGNKVSKFSMEIYNRWGEKVFSSTDIKHGWDGTYKGSLQPIGVYNYIIEAEMLDKRIIKKAGPLDFYY